MSYIAPSGRASLLAMALAMALVAGACAEDLGQRLGPDAGVDQNGPIAVEDQGDGVRQARVNARAEEPWIYVDLAAGAAVAEELAEQTNWDLAFRRFHIRLAGDADGTGDGAMALLSDVSFDDLAQVPAEDAFVTDAADDDGDGIPEYVMSIGDLRWYDYEVSTHALTPRDVVYVVRGGDGRYYKLQMLDYYDSAGTAGYPAFRWAALDGPAARRHTPAATPPAPGK